MKISPSNIPTQQTDMDTATVIKAEFDLSVMIVDHIAESLFKSGKGINDVTDTVMSVCDDLNRICNIGNSLYEEAERLIKKHSRTDLTKLRRAIHQSPEYEKAFEHLSKGLQKSEHHLIKNIIAI